MSRRDSGRLDADGSARVVDWLRLARARARIAASRGGLDRRDLIGAAYLGLCQAALTYRPETAVPFGVWARIRIDLALRRELAFLRRHPIALAGADEIALPEPDTWPDWLAQAWAEMPIDRRDLVESRLAGETLASIGRRLDLTPSGVRAAYLREIAWLRSRAPADGRS